MSNPAIVHCRNNMYELPIVASALNWEQSKWLECLADGSYAPATPNDLITSCETGVFCPKLPPQPVGQPEYLPWDGNVTLMRDSFYFSGKTCMGKEKRPPNFTGFDPTSPAFSFASAAWNWGLTRCWL